MAQHEPEYYSFRPEQPEDADTGPRLATDISSISSEAANTRDRRGISRQEAASTSQTMSGQARPVMLRLRSLGQERHHQEAVPEVRLRAAERAEAAAAGAAG